MDYKINPHRDYVHTIKHEKYYNVLTLRVQALTSSLPAVKKYSR